MTMLKDRTDLDYGLLNNAFSTVVCIASNFERIWKKAGMVLNGGTIPTFSYE
jgi:hypothetical protein